MLRRKQTNNRNERIRAKLSSLNSAAITEAQDEIRSMQPDEAVTLLVTMIENDRKIRRSIPVRILAVVSIGFVICWALNLLVNSDSSAGAFGGIGGVFMALLASNRLRANTASLLSQFDDPRLIDALVMHYRNGPTSAYGPQKALTRLLPTLTPAQTHLVSRESRAFLNYALLNNTNKDLVLAILTAWTQVGDHDAIPVVEQLAGAGGYVEKDATIREAASAALPAIRDAANRATISETLLRPADSGESTSLLRPAGSGETTEAVLLRPSTDQHTQ